MKHLYLKNVTTLKLSHDKCVGCGMCALVCPHRVFAVNGGQAKIINLDGCMECGACALNCPADAISVEANVGCASAIIKGWLTGTEPSCDCSSGGCRGGSEKDASGPLLPSRSLKRARAASPIQPTE